MGLISDKDKKMLEKMFQEKLKDDVKMILFRGEKDECMYCSETEDILKEVSSLSDKILLDIYDFKKDSEMVEKYNIDKIPATVIEGKKDYGIRFFGIPAGYEFTTVIEDIMDVSAGRPELTAEIIDKVNSIKEPVTLEVFVTPSCPYCPQSVRVAHKFAMVNDNIKGHMIEATEFPELSAKYNVSGVPKTVINSGKGEYVGAYPDDNAIDEVIKSLGK